MLIDQATPTRWCGSSEHPALRRGVTGGLIVGLMRAQPTSSR